MAIISLTFIAFAALLLLIYYTIGKKYQWIILLLANAVFYLAGGWRGALFLLVTMCTVYLISLKLDRYNEKQEEAMAGQGDSAKSRKLIKKEYTSKKKVWLLLAVLINLGILCAVKYTVVVVESISSLFHTNLIGMYQGLNIIVPLGISFYTFQAVGYVIDVYRGKTHAEKNFFKLALFVSFFPIITQGPILRFETVKDQLYTRHDFDYKAFTFGLQRMVWGFFKKLVIAVRLAEIYQGILQNYSENDYCGVIIFIGVFLGGFHTYVDFSGGMDIVIGLAESLGIVIPENFKRPYMARSYSEFWRRWHISLGAWFKNYVFYPLSLSKAFNSLSKKCRKRFGEHLGKVLAPSMASFITLFIIGIWHGANLKYVAYGIWQAIFVAQQTLFEDMYERMRIRLRINTEKFYFRFFQIIRTILLVTFGRYFSFAENLTDALKMLGVTFTRFTTGLFSNNYYGFGLMQKGSLVMYAGILMFVIVDILQESGIHLRETIAKQNIVIRWTIYLAAVFAVIIFGQYGLGYDAASFVYQGF